MRQVVFRKQARLEFDEAGDWCEKERHGLGLEFLAEIHLLIRRIAGNPEQFPMLYRDVQELNSHEPCVGNRMKLPTVTADEAKNCFKG